MYIVADIGGTKTRVAAVRDFERFEEPVIFDTPHVYEEAMAKLVEVIKGIAGTESISHVALGIPGSQSTNHRSTFISGTGPLCHWSNVPVADDIENALGTKLLMENDTAMVGLGEATFGAGRGADILVYITVSTGVGGARIVDGKIDRMAHGAEMGGQYISMSDRKTLENSISGTAVHEKFGMNPRDLGKSSPVWEELANTLAFGVYNTLLHWSPNRVVLGGSMFNEIGIPVERVKFYVNDINVKLPEIPDIVHSELGDLGGLYGGLALLRQNLEG